MKKATLAVGALIGAVTTLPMLALFYLGANLAGLPFVPFDLFDWMARVLPGPIVTFGIDTIVNLIRLLDVGTVSETAKTAEQSLALVQLVVAGAVVGLVVTLVVRRSERSGTEVGAVAGIILFLLFLVAEVQLGFSGNPLLNLGWIGLVTVGWGTATGAAIMGAAAPSGEAAVDSARRSALLKVAGGSLGLALGAWGAGRLLAEDQTAQVAEAGASQPLPTPGPTSAPTVATSAATATPAAVTPTPNLEDRLEPAPGTRPEVTDNEDFYRIDINTRSPVIDREEWVL